MSHTLLSLKPLLIVTLLGLLVALIGAVAFAWSNPASKTIALATAALLGAAVLFLLQLTLELRGSEESDSVPVEFTIDRAKPALVPDYSPGWRQLYEIGASEWLAENSPGVLLEPDRVTRDFALAELLLFFAHAEPDWQVATTSFRGSRSTLSLREQPVSEKPDHYTEVGPADFLAALRKTGNALAGYESPTFPARGARFPPGTTMTLGDRSLTLSNRFGSLQFTLSAASGGVSVIPLTNKASPILPDGKPQFETDLLGIRIVNRQTALYSQHRDAAKQAAWRKRVISGLRSWFEPRPSRVDRIEDKAFWGE